MKKLYRPVIGLLAVLMVLLSMSVMITPKETDAAAVKMTLEELQKKFPDGRYWNGGNPDKTTKTACSDHVNQAGPVGNRCNMFYDKATKYSLYQCWGFAFKLGYDAFGTFPGSWTKKDNLDSLKPGDIVRYGNGSHVIFITAVSGDKVKFADCNKNTTCQIRWNVSATKDDIPIKSIKAAKMEGDGVYSAPTPLGKTFTVKYNANGGKGSMKNTIVPYGVSTSLRANSFTRDWYKFSGWNLYKHSSKQWYYTNGSKTGWYTKGSQPAGYKLEVYKDKHKVAWTTNIDKDTIEVFAVWSPAKTFTVRYNANGGSGSMADTVVGYGIGDYLRSNTFTRKGFEFGGWNLYKHSSQQWYYTNGSDAGWYAEGNQPAGYELEIYKDGAKVKWTSEKDKDIVELFAVWNPVAAEPAAGATVETNEGIVRIISATDKTVILNKSRNSKSVTVPASVTIEGQKYKITEIGTKAFIGKKIRTVTIGKNVKTIKKNAFKGSKVTKVILKTKLLTKSSVKGSLKGSKVKTVQVKIGTKKVNKTYMKKYKKIFTKANAGKKVTVK